MIRGLGIEWVDLPRFERALARHGDRLRARLFTEQERVYAARRTRAGQSLAVRFAAKAAARRALGAPVAWQEVEVVRERGRAPTLRFHGRAAQLAASRGVAGACVTLTHDRVACVAHVVLEGGA